jgi:NADH:ubiquinone reductase (H+-translocating)
LFMRKKIPVEQKNIVILGGGFAGIRAALDLNDYLLDQDEYQIILVDRKEFQTYQPSLYEAATAQHGLVEAKKVRRGVTIPFAQIFERTKVKVFQGFVDRVDLANGQVVTDSRVINYSHLLVALGGVSDYSNAQGVEKYGFGLKSLEEAIMIRNRVEDIVSKKDKGTMVIVGGSFVGVEFAGELHNLLKHECETHGKMLKNFQIIVADGSTSFLPGLPENVSSLATRRLNEIGVISKFSSLVTEAGNGYVVFNMKERLECDLLVWCAGIKGVPLVIDPQLELDKKGRLVTTEFLNLAKFPNVFVAGDYSGFTNPHAKRLLQQNCAEAIRQGALAAKNIYRMIKVKHLHVYAPRSTRYIIPIVGKYAVVYTPNVLVSGIFGWQIRRLMDLKYFLSVLPFFKALKFWLFENKIWTKND